MVLVIRKRGRRRAGHSADVCHAAKISIRRTGIRRNAGEHWGRRRSVLGTNGCSGVALAIERWNVISLDRTMSSKRKILPCGHSSRRLSRSAVGLICGCAALSFAVVTFCVPAYAILDIRGYPRGTQMRPMSLALVVGLSSAAAWTTVPFGLACVALGWRRWPHWIIGLIAALLGGSTWWLCRWLFHWVVESNGYIIGD